MSTRLIARFLALIVIIAPLSARSADEAPSPPYAEMLYFQEVPSVYGASKYEQKVTEAPSSVTIITAEEIRRYGYRTLADILRSVRSFYTTYDRNYTYLGVRGFGRPGDYNSRVLLIIDGHRLNDNIYDSVLAGTEGVLDVDSRPRRSDPWPRSPTLRQQRLLRRREHHHAPRQGAEGF
jgi:iron complex outermembrane receptor protein